MAEWEIRDNSPSLGARLGADLTSAALTALSVSPLVCLIDNSIANRVATGRPIFSYAAGVLRHPNALLRTLLTSPAGRYVYFVYFCTFSSANIADTVLEQHSISVASNTTARLTKFAFVSSVSTAATVWKDVRLAHCFVPIGKTASKVPFSSLGLFVARDCVTIFSSFILPPIVAKNLASSIESQANTFKAAQLLLPMATQLITTPIHLAGYYLHYDPVKRGLKSRIASIRADMSSAVPIRMLRILPAFGAGTLLNTSLRDHFLRIVQFSSLS